MYVCMYIYIYAYTKMTRGPYNCFSNSNGNQGSGKDLVVLQFRRPAYDDIIYHERLHSVSIEQLSKVFQGLMILEVSY